MNNKGKIRHVGRAQTYLSSAFSKVKNLPTADSGMICFKREKDLFLARKSSWLGIDKDTYSEQVLADHINGNMMFPILAISWKFNYGFDRFGTIKLP